MSLISLSWSQCSCPQSEAGRFYIVVNSLVAFLWFSIFLQLSIFLGCQTSVDLPVLQLNFDTMVGVATPKWKKLGTLSNS